MLYLLGPREVADVDQTVYTFLELYKYTEVGEVANLCSVLAAERILVLDSLPGSLAELLDTQTHLALIAVKGQDDCLNLFAYLQELLS